MSDTSSVRSSSRASTLMSRPQSTPMGPRTRQTSTRSSIPVDHNTRSELNALDLTEFGAKPLTSSSPAPMSPMSSHSMPSSTRRSLQPVSEEALASHQLHVSDPETNTQTSTPPSDTEALSTSRVRASMSALGEPNSPSSIAPWQAAEDNVAAQVEEVPTSIVQRQEIPEEPRSPRHHTHHDSRFPSDVDPDSEPQSPIIPPSEPSISEPVAQELPLSDPVVQELPEEITKPKVVIPPPQKLSFPAPIKFENASVPWKGLPLDAALWTVDSGELQDIVSRAIRASASESFVRLLTASNLDTVLPAEKTRLESLKAVTQSKYRFLVHRRTMLFQALNSTSLSQQKDGEDGVSVVSRLASQLADTIGECDQNLAEIIGINDQITQINKLIDIHWSSALAIALRKLNGSYARRNNDLAAAQERITQLEAELKDAWKEAQRMAQELDDYEAAIVADDTEAVIETAEVVAVPKPTPTHSRRTSMPMSPTLLEFAPTTSATPKSPVSPASPGMSNFVFPPVVHLKAKETEAVDVPDTVSIRSNRSGKSHRSGWTAESNNFVSAVYAAKKRSHRASQSSLRLSGGHGKRHSEHRSRTPFDDHPPVPDLPVRFTPFNGMMNTGSASASSTLLNFDPHISPYLRRQVSLDSVRTGASRHGPSAYRGKTAAMDDLYIRSQRSKDARESRESEIQVIPRAASQASTTQNFASMYEHHSSTRSSTEVARPALKVKDPSKTIPSMWMNVDAVKPNRSNGRPKSSEARLQPQVRSPPRRSPSNPSTSSPSSVENPSAMSHSPQSQTNKTSTRNSTYEKIRGLTKRYSVSLPMFNSQTRLASRRSG